MRTIRFSLRAIALGFMITSATAISQAADGKPEVPEPLSRLAVIAGHWKAQRVEFLDDEGNVARVSQAEARNTIRLDGLAIHHQGRLVEPEIRTEGWIYYDPTKQRMKMSSVSSRGRYDEFIGQWKDASLIMTIVPGEDQTRQFRLIYSDFSENGFRERLEISTNDGETWRTSSRQVFTRVQ